MDRRRNLMADVVSGGGMEMVDFELVGTKDVTTPTSEVVFELSKPCKEIVIIGENIKATTSSQLAVALNKNAQKLTGMNGEINEKYNIGVFLHIRHICNGLWEQIRRIAPYQAYVASGLNGSVRLIEGITEVSSIALKTDYPNINFTAGNIKIYGR